MQLTVPGHLRFRSVAVRFVAESCRLVSGSAVVDERGARFEVVSAFDTAFVSGFMEIFNNIAVHAYQHAGLGQIELRATVEPDRLTIELQDTGGAFDIRRVPVPDMDALPEGGMGIHIARSLLDEVSYVPGPPNVWRLMKQLVPDANPQSQHTQV
jgi:hypothetical protein